MDYFVPDHLLNLLAISTTFSIILMMFIQKIKTLNFIKKSWQVWIINFVSSFLIGIPFGMNFYDIGLNDALWIGLFSFIGAASIYQVLRDQNLINYKPNSVSDTITLSKDKEIKR